MWYGIFNKANNELVLGGYRKIRIARQDMRELKIWHPRNKFYVKSYTKKEV